MRAFAASLFVVLMVAGCSDQEPEDRVGSPATATATPTSSVVRGQPGGVTPPSAYLEDNAGKVIEGATGSYCWQLGSTGSCADYSPWLSNPDPIPIDSGETLEFQFDAGTPRETKLRWLDVDGITARDLGGVLDWTPMDGGPRPYADSLTAPVEPGLYVLAVFALFPEGDVTYGFHIEVR